MAEKKSYLVAYTAGWGDQRRMNQLAMEFHSALKRALGAPPATLMGGVTRDAGVFSVSSEMDAQGVYHAIVEA